MSEPRCARPILGLQQQKFDTAAAKTTTNSAAECDQKSRDCVLSPRLLATYLKMRLSSPDIMEMMSRSVVLPLITLKAAVAASCAPNARHAPKWEAVTAETAKEGGSQC